MESVSVVLDLSLTVLLMGLKTTILKRHVNEGSTLLKCSMLEYINTLERRLPGLKGLIFFRLFSSFPGNHSSSLLLSLSNLAFRLLGFLGKYDDLSTGIPTIPT